MEVMSPVARYLKFIVGENLLSKFQCNVTAVGGLGLGIEGGNGEGDGRFVVSVLLPGRPAAEQGSLRLGDVLVSVNGTPLAGLTLEEGCALIAMSTAIVRLEVEREGDPPTIELITLRVQSIT